MQNHLKLRAVGFFLCALALTAAHHKSATVALMVNAANRFVESLNTRFQRPMTVFKFDAADRTNWHYFPEGGFTQTHGYERNGITFAEMDAKQQHLAHGLLSTGLSKTGYAKAVDVMALEDIVRVIEADTTGHRDTQGFHFTIFGEPSLTAIWGWRVEGHHLSLHYTIENGKLVSASPHVLWRQSSPGSSRAAQGHARPGRRRGSGSGVAAIPRSRKAEKGCLQRRRTFRHPHHGRHASGSSRVSRKACRRPR